MILLSSSWQPAVGRPLGVRCWTLKLPQIRIAQAMVLPARPGLQGVKQQPASI